MGTPGLAPYCATKFAVEGFTEALHHELGCDGIEVTMVEPGTFPTDIFSDSSFVTSGDREVDTAL